MPATTKQKSPKKSAKKASPTTAAPKSAARSSAEHTPLTIGERRETDSMGEMFVPSDALYGATTQRAGLNFPVSFRTVPQAQIEAYIQLK
jgi:fumarate hydratase class II